MIVMLDYLEVNIEILDVDIETMESDGCREISEANRNTNGILTMMWEKTRFSYKDRQKFINPFTQLISRLCQVS